MAAQNAEETPDGGFLKLIRHAREQMQMARGDYYREKLNGSVSLHTRRELARAAVQYYDVLWEYRVRDQQIKQAWEQSNVDLIQQLSDETAQVATDTPGDSPGSATAERNALVACDPDMVVELTKELDSLANEMGFAAGMRQGRNLGKVGE